MSQQQEPSLQALAAEAARVRTERENSLRAKFRGMPLEGLEQLADDPASPLSTEQREEVRKYLVLGKRESKSRLERMERMGDVFEKSGLPMAVTGFSAYTWLVHSIGLDGTLRTALDILVFMGAVSLWVLLRVAAWLRINRARKMLLDLGKVD